VKVAIDKRRRFGGCFRKERGTGGERVKNGKAERRVLANSVKAPRRKARVSM